MRNGVNERMDTLSIFLERASRLGNKKSEEALLQLLVFPFGDSEFRKVSCDRMLRVYSRLALDFCRGVGTSCSSVVFERIYSSVVFERIIRAYYSSVKRENSFFIVSLFHTNRNLSSNTHTRMLRKTLTPTLEHHTQVRRI